MWIWDFVVGIILRIHIHSIQRKRRRKRHSSSCSSKHIAVLVAFMSIATSALHLFYCSFIYLVLFVSLHFHLRVLRTAMDNNNSTFAIICNYIILEKWSCVAQEMWAQRSSNIKKTFSNERIENGKQNAVVVVDASTSIPDLRVYRAIGESVLAYIPDFIINFNNDAHQRTNEPYTCAYSQNPYKHTCTAKLNTDFFKGQQAQFHFSNIAIFIRFGYEYWTRYYRALRFTIMDEFDNDRFMNKFSFDLLNFSFIFSHFVGSRTSGDRWKLNVWTTFCKIKPSNLRNKCIHYNSATLFLPSYTFRDFMIKLWP